MVQFNDGVKVIRIQKKIVLFKILIFSQVSDVQNDTVLWCWVVAASHSFQPAMQLQG